MKYFPGKRKKYIIMMLMSVFIITGFADTGNNNKKYNEYEVKAGLLRNFLVFVEYPGTALPGKGDPMIIGIIGRDPFGELLDNIAASATVKGRKLIIKRFKHTESIEQLKKCHLLFISAYISRTKAFSRAKIKSILDELKTLPVLTISEVNGFGHLGGMINLVIVNNEVKFEINKTAADQAGLKFRSNLLNLAIEIIGANHAK